MFPKFDKVINDDPQPSGSTSANTCINANVSRRKLSEQEAEARLRVYDEAISHLEVGDCYDDEIERAQSKFVINEIKRLCNKFEGRFYGG